MGLSAILAVLAAAGAQGAEPRVIEVEGRAVIAAMPDQFTISAEIREQEPTQPAALAKVAKSFERIKRSLSDLSAIDKLAIDSDGAAFGPVRDPQCTSEADDEDACRIIGYAAEISMEISGSPAKSAGTVLSMLVESGALSTSLDGYRVSDDTAWKEKALKAAVDDATAKARVIAAASGARIKGLARIQAGRGLAAGYGGEQIIVTASKIGRPKIALDLDPQPIDIAAEVVAAFEIE